MNLRNQEILFQRLLGPDPERVRSQFPPPPATHSTHKIIFLASALELK